MGTVDLDNQGRTPAATLAKSESVASLGPAIRESIMQRHEQQSGHKRSVLDGKKDISGLPKKQKAAIERARGDDDAKAECDNVLDGPACIDGVPEAGEKR
jgi:hypothetical protein